MQDIFGGGSSEVVAEVPIEHLDYAYVERCESSKELMAILSYLKSGKEGRYDHLEKTVEARLLGMCKLVVLRTRRSACFSSQSCI